MLEKIPETTLTKIYDDGLQPALSESGKALGRIPRAINAALAPLDQWILQKEYSVAETKLALEKKLQSVNPEKIVPPEPYVAVPALQAISYCMSNKELYNLYANLLSKAMIKESKNDVHPAFIEIIKQMSPNDAIVLKEILSDDSPIAKVNYSISLKVSGIRFMGQLVPHKFFNSSIYNIRCHSLSEDQISISVDNLHRLGIIDFKNITLSDSSLYTFADKTNLYIEVQNKFEEMKGTIEEPERIKIKKTCACITSFGKLFGNICVLGFDAT